MTHNMMSSVDTNKQTKSINYVSGSTGFRIYFQGSWCVEQWPTDWVQLGLTRDLTFLEFFPLVVAVHLWPLHLQHQVVKFGCSNLAVDHMVKKLISHSQRVMRLVGRGCASMLASQHCVCGTAYTRGQQCHCRCVVLVSGAQIQGVGSRGECAI